MCCRFLKIQSQWNQNSSLKKKKKKYNIKNKKEIAKQYIFLSNNKKHTYVNTLNSIGFFLFVRARYSNGKTGIDALFC